MPLARVTIGLALACGRFAAAPRAQPVFRGDEILITETGHENLSAFVPIEVKDIETLMAEPA